MKILNLSKLVAVLLVVFSSSFSFGQNLYEPSETTWEPIKDDVFMQEVAKKIKTNSPVTSIAQINNNCFAVMDGKLHSIEGDQLKALNGAPANVNELKTIEGSLWALAQEGVYQYNKGSWNKIDNQKFVDITIHRGVLYGATRDDLFFMKDGRFVNTKPEGGYLNSDFTNLMADGTQVHLNPVKIGPIQKIQSFNETIYILRPGEVVVFDGEKVNTDHIDWGKLPSKTTRDMTSHGSKLFVSTDRGLSVLRGAAYTLIKGEDGLPYENTTCLEKGANGDLWIGTTKGAVRMMKDDWHYFAADHWLPGNGVNDIAVGDNVTYIATEKGIGIISYEPYTLLKKSEFYERHLEEWGHKRLGFVHTVFKHDGEWIRHISDNDGGHTAPYLAAMSFKYAVTGDEETRKKAIESFKAMLWLERITPIDGLVARAIWTESGDDDKKSAGGSGGLHAKWNKAAYGDWYWKGDTSSDEIIAHFYAVSIFHDLVANKKEKEEAKNHLASIAGYIMDNGFLLVDLDGKPTRWGRWDPEYLLRPYGYQDRGVNGLEVLTFMKTAYALTGEQRFEEGYQQLVKLGYAENTIKQKNTFPPAYIAPWDDNLAYRAYYTLLRYTNDALDRSTYMRSIARTYEVKRIEQVSLYNFVYGAITGHDCEQHESVKHLRAWQLDCIGHNYTNSDRHDLHVADGYISYERGTKAISPRESEVNRNSRYAMNQDGGQNGNRLMEPTAFVRDYWLGRYHKMIEAPATNDPELISVKRNKEWKNGAKPYEGPKAPKLY